MEELEIILEVENDNELEINILEEEIKEVFPELEDLEVIPTVEEQNFKSDKYGYNNVTVKAIETEEITIQPGTEEQVKEGIFNKVTVLGDEDLKPENIKKGTNIFGVEGIGNMTNAKITNASYLFYNEARLDDLDSILDLCDWDKIKDCTYMFTGCTSITSLDVSNFNTSNVTNMSCMFVSCTVLKSLDLSSFNTSNVVNMSSMFSSCNNLASLDISNFDTNKVTNMYNMFQNCGKLISLDVSNFDTSKVTNMGYMFNNCYELTELDISNFDMSSVNNINYMFGNCRNLVDLKFGTNLGKGYTKKSNNSSQYVLDLYACTRLTHDSLMSAINNLYDLNLTYDVANGGTLYTQMLNLGSTNLAKLTAEEIAIATNKGWNVS